MLAQSDIEDAAMFLLHLHTSNSQVAGLPGELSPKTLDEAYAIQDALHRYGGWDIGMIKVGCTSEAAQTALGIPHPVGGRVPVSGIHSSGASIDPNELGLLPLIECEFAVRVDADGQPDAVAPAMELVGGRYKSLTNVSGLAIIADNVASRAVVLGEPVPVTEAGDLLATTVELTGDGQTLATGTGASVEGGPVESVAWTLAHEASRERAIAAGTWIITGTCTGLTASEPATTYVADFGALGSVSFALA